MVNNVSNDPVRSTATVLVATACVSHIDPKTIFGRRDTTTSCPCATISPSHHHRRTGPADAESAYHSLWNRRRPTAHWLPFFPARRITIDQQNRVVDSRNRPAQRSNRPFLLEC